MMKGHCIFLLFLIVVSQTWAQIALTDGNTENGSLATAGTEATYTFTVTNENVISFSVIPCVGAVGKLLSTPAPLPPHCFC